MRKQTIYRLSIRLTEKDIDLLWLDADPLSLKLSALVKLVLRGEVSGQRERIPLPRQPQKPVQPKTIGIRFYKKEDEEIADWIKQFQKGYRGLVIKELLRHSVEIFDYRPYAVGVQTLTERESNSFQRFQGIKSVTNEPEAQKHKREAPVEMESEEDSEDDWLTAFEEMAKQ